MIANLQQKLGLDPNGHYSNDDYKKAYRKLAAVHHPDKGGDEEKFKEVKDAYEKLTGKQEFRNFEQSPGFDPFSHMHDVFDQMNQQYAGRWHRSRPPERDADIGIEFNVSVEDIKKGREFSFTYKKSKPCKDCDGVGGKEKTVCQNCNGKGMIIQQQRAGNVQFATQFPCPACRGAGQSIKDPCSACNAQGFVIESEDLTFEVRKK